MAISGSDKVCEFHDDTRRVLVKLSTSSEWLVRLLGASLAMGIPLLLTMTVTFMIYVSKLETRVVSLEKADRDILTTLQQIKNQRNMDHARSGFKFQ